MSLLMPLLLEGDPLPRGGVWLRVAGLSEFRLTSRLPRHLLATRLNRSLFIPEEPAGDLAPRHRRALRLLRLIRPFLVRTDACSPERFDTRLESRHGGRDILISLEHARVLHRSDEPIICTGTERTRRRWAAHVTSPAFVPSPCGRRLEESFLAGRHVAELDADGEIQVIRRILEMHRDLAQAEASEASDELRRAFEAASVDLRDPGAPSGVPRSVVCPQTASVDNIVVLQGSEPAFIDVHPLAETPFYAQPLRVLRNWGRISQRPLELVRSGAFDAELVALLEAGGLQVPRGRSPGEHLLDLPTPTVPVPVSVRAP
jgi:hypothetical protein